MNAIRLRAGTVCVESQKVLLVRLKDPVSGVERLFPPGGGIEAGETPEQTAIRETYEETGYKVRLLGRSVIARYTFEWAAQRYDCTTHLFRARLENKAPESPETVGINIGFEWILIQEVAGELSYDRFIREAVLKLLT